LSQVLRSPLEGISEELGEFFPNLSSKLFNVDWLKAASRCWSNASRSALISSANISTVTGTENRTKNN
jgi:hypothetical protein